LLEGGVGGIDGVGVDGEEDSQRGVGALAEEEGVAEGDRNRLAVGVDLSLRLERESLDGGVEGGEGELEGLAEVVEAGEMIGAGVDAGPAGEEGGHAGELGIDPGKMR
jgi:hypothetical protein